MSREGDFRRQIEREEYLRHQARKRLQEADDAHQRQIEQSHLRDQAYIEEHGREFAAKWTFAKWFVAGLFFSIGALFLQDDNPMGERIGGALLIFAVFAIIGVWRAAKFARLGL